MRILETLASADPATGGPIEGVLRHADIWQKQGHSVELATLDAPDASFLKQNPIRIHALGPSGSQKQGFLRTFPGMKHYGYASGYVSWLKRHYINYDAIIINGLWNYSVMGARLALAGSKTPYFVFSHGMMDPWFKQSNGLKHLVKQGFWLFNEGILIHNAKALLFTTEEERLLAKNMFWPYRPQEAVVGYGTADIVGDKKLQISAFRSILPALKDRAYILYLSRLHPKKGCDMLIAAFARLAARFSQLDLVIAGPDQGGYQQVLKAQAAALGLDHRIHWPGLLLGDFKWGAFHGCEAFILPSHQENFGVVVAEALAASKPVLISNKVNIWREVQDAGAGYVEPDNVDGVIRLLQRYLTGTMGEHQAIGEAGRRLFLEKYQIETAANRLLATIQSTGPQIGVEQNVFA